MNELSLRVIERSTAAATSGGGQSEDLMQHLGFRTQGLHITVVVLVVHGLRMCF